MVSGTINNKDNRIKLVEATTTTYFPNKLFNSMVGPATSTTKHIFGNGMLLATIENGTASTTTVGGGAISTSTIALDATSTSITNGFSGTVTKTWTHTVTGTSPIIILSADIFQDIGGTGAITLASWNGGSFTLASTTRTGTKATELWYLIATTTGSKTMSVTITGNTDAIKLAASSFTGVSPSAPLDAVAVSGGTSGNPSASVTVQTQNAVVVTTLNRHSTTDATSSRSSCLDMAKFTKNNQGRT